MADPGRMNDSALAEVAMLLRERNALDLRLGAIVGRPPEKGHLGEWIAARIFDIELMPGAAYPVIDGRFRQMPGNPTVNIKWYFKREGGLDMTESIDLDYYLVLTGPTAAAVSSLGMTRPAVISAVYLFNAPRLLAGQRARGVKIGVFSSITNAQWLAAEVFPQANCSTLTVTPVQRRMLEMFAA
jgi:hypothetical protein